MEMFYLTQNYSHRKIQCKRSTRNDAIAASIAPTPGDSSNFCWYFPTLNYKFQFPFFKNTNYNLKKKTTYKRKQKTIIAEVTQLDKNKKFKFKAMKL